MMTFYYRNQKTINRLEKIRSEKQMEKSKLVNKKSLKDEQRRFYRVKPKFSIKAFFMLI